ncbi:MAG: transposase [Desulforhopalus sp.]
MSDRLLVNLKQCFDEEKKTGRVAKGLRVGEATVKRIMAAAKDKGEEGAVVEEKERGKPPYRLSLNLQPII